MRCLICNKEAAETSVFCSNCGTRLIKAEENVEVNNQTVNESEAFNFSFTAEEYISTPISDVQTQKDTTEPPTTPQNDGFSYYIPPKKKKSLIKIILVPVVALLLVSAIIFGVFYSSMFFGPMTNIGKATMKTFNSQSFNFKLQLNTDGQAFEFNGTFIFEPENRIIEFYAETSEINSYFSPNNIKVLLKDGFLITDSGENQIDRIYINEQLNTLFDEYEKNKNTKKTSEIDWKEIFESLDIDTDNIDLDVFGNAIDEFLNNLNNEDYINENLGDYSKKNRNGDTIYTFKLNAKDTAEELVEVFGDAFTLPNDYDFEMIENQIQIGLEQTFGGSSCSFIFKTNSGYLTNFSIKNTQLTFSLEMSDFGDAEIDKDIDLYDDYINQSTEIVNSQI
ncbi:MAG: hypothetical protein A2Y15_00080 [Clostridiales bacterium GWF2_36_10]|nr:MAG: hypothetical protein A2Y15_00080 [Clostridiales bacterium GWF2_36_10]HAN20248.1 hypothetical protein [Clostridiales bacterium]